ncbi:hypothetical protein G6O69_28475 [Pseudenhygromyxa sp. WMMC2535]|uniref:hypothetical protein n=1 Tax=Pseudenhygromyxa sp. WMMC2535 TaxID=2712867 RepID=UPI001556E737|nr:hypothetical protein [Pseudenhygromyxa sp. WMMC2535]NVB41802.1 hypothetical protein [Pseudenhygromyxa sp. WMMC2535]
MKIESIHYTGDGSCVVTVLVDGRARELVCSIVEARGVKMITSEPDELDRLGADPRPLVSAVLAFLEAAKSYNIEQG